MRRAARPLRVLLFAGLGALGAWNELPFITAIGAGFAVAELLRDRLARAIVASATLLIAGLVLVAEALVIGRLDVSTVLALTSGLFVAGTGGYFLYRARGAALPVDRGRG